MAKRFITTEMYKDTWFMDLSAKYKLLWLFLLTDCSHAGVWQVNYKVAEFYVGDHLEPIECERILKGRIVKFEEGKYWFIPKFIEFQYGTILSSTNKALVGVIDVLLKNDLLKHLPKVKVHQGATKELPSSLNGVKEKDKEKEFDKVREQETLPMKKDLFIEFWKEYPRKDAKSKAEQKFNKVCKDEKIFKEIMAALKIHKQTNDWLKENGQYIPYAISWLNQERWKDELICSTERTKSEYQHSPLMQQIIFKSMEITNGQD